MQLIWHLEGGFSGMLMWVMFATPLIFLMALNGRLRTRVYGTVIGSALVMGVYGAIQGGLDKAVAGVKYPERYQIHGNSYQEYVLDGVVSGIEANLAFLIYMVTFVAPFVVLLYVSPIDPSDGEP